MHLYSQSICIGYVVYSVFTPRRRVIARMDACLCRLLAIISSVNQRIGVVCSQEFLEKILSLQARFELLEGQDYGRN